MQQFSSFEGCVEADEESLHCMNRVEEFISGEYLNILENAQYHVIYFHDVRMPKLGGMFENDHHEDYDSVTDEAEWARNDVFDELGGRISSRTAAWREITQHSEMYGFDQITAISQSAVNSHFRAASRVTTQRDTRAIASGTLLSSWRYEEFFQGTFKPLTVRLRSDGRAIVFIHLQEGFLHALKNWVPSLECVLLTPTAIA